MGAEKHHLAEIMREHGLEWVQKGTHEEHLSVLDFKKQERAKEVEELSQQTKQLEERKYVLEDANDFLASQLSQTSQEVEAQRAERDKAIEEAEAARQQEQQMKERMKELAPSIKDLEHFADKYSKNAEKVLPEAGALESARVYREKRAKPLYERIITVLRDLYKQFKDLIKKYNQLVTAHNDKCSDYEQLEGHCQWLEGENSQLSVKLHTVQKDYSRVRRVLGDVMVDNALFAAEQLEQEAEQREGLLEQQHQLSKFRNRSSPSL